MAALVCDLCGGKLVMGASGIAVCDSCGMEHSADRMKEKVQEIKGTVRVDNTHMITTYLEMTATALEAGNNEEAENYANKVIEIDPRSAKAWFYKGKAVGWQTTGRNNRYPESIANWINAYSFSSLEEREELVDDIKAEARKIGAAILQLECNSFADFRSDDNKEDVTNALDMIEEQLELLKEKTEIDVYTDAFKVILASTVNAGAINASDNADQDFGPENINRDKYSWNRYTEAQDWCLTLLDKAYSLCSDDDLCHTICENYIAIAEAVRDSCSYKFQPSAYSDGTYVRDYSFTQSAKEYRTNTINKWKKKRDNHDPELRKSNCKKAIDLYILSCGEANRKLAIEQYWDAHASEKVALDNELAEIERKKSDLNAEAANNSDKHQAEQIDKEIAAVRNQMNSLGLFKGKEKKALAARIEELTATKQTYENRWMDAKKQIDSKLSALDKRKSEISQEFTKDRGTAKLTHKQYITVFENGSGVVSGLDLVSYHKAILPNGFSVKGEGNDAVENYTRSVMIKYQATFSDEMDLSYADNPETKKVYRINFQANGEDTHVSVNFIGKTIDTPIGDYLIYQLEKEKTPRAVANFIQIVISAIIGICPSIELAGMEKKISEAAYGLAPEASIEVDNLICTITGCTKSDLMFAIKPATSK